MAIEGLSLRLYLDHNMDPLLADDVRGSGFDALHAQEVGNERAPDDVQLHRAASRGRAVVTRDLGDFPVLAQQWAVQGRTHAGIILVVSLPRLSYGAVLRRLLAFLDTVTADEMIDQVRWLDPPEAL